jgi:YggT family protein
MVQAYLALFIQFFFDLLNWAVLVYILATWVTGPGNRLFDFLADITRPVLGLAKKITPKTGMLDLSPVIAMLGLEVVKNILLQIITLI